MKKLIIVAAALFAMSAFAADPATTTSAPADAGMNSAPKAEGTTAKPKKAHKDHANKMEHKAKGEKKAPADASAPAAAGGEAK